MRGKTIKWLEENVGYSGDDCLIWPFSVHPSGYGSFGLNGRMYYAHRYMCFLAHGYAPSEKHYASHNCSNGHNGCVNPKHLAWKTPSENAKDRILVGRQMKAGRRRHKLTKDQAREILKLKGTISQRALADNYGVSRETISSIHTGRGWSAIR